jgi:hypothetical protein
VNLYGFKIGETYLLDPKDPKIINKSDWNNFIDAIKKDEEDYKKIRSFFKKKKFQKLEKNNNIQV